MEARIAMLGAGNQREECERELQRILAQAVTAAEREANERRRAEQMAKEAAASDLEAACRTLDYGLVGGTVAEREHLRDAIESARDVLPAPDVAQAERVDLVGGDAGERRHEQRWGAGGRHECRFQAG